MEFYVYETNETIRAEVRPIVIITSNNEKELPDAFLRRCFFHYIKFPDADTMKQIIHVHFPDLKKELLASAMKVFYDVRDIGKYIKLGPLGEALAAPSRVVLLIDEIDKADIEFPNDLLLELDAMRFRVDETGREVVAKERPIVIITSNNEKELPDAFLRRCVFHYIQFPDRELMTQIVRVHHPDVTDRVLDNALEMFFGLRATPKLRKKPSTSELIDWIMALKKANVDLSRVSGGIPFLGTLLKTEQDVELVGKRAKA